MTTEDAEVKSCASTVDHSTVLRVVPSRVEGRLRSGSPELRRGVTANRIFPPVLRVLRGGVLSLRGAPDIRSPQLHRSSAHQLLHFRNERRRRPDANLRTDVDFHAEPVGRLAGLDLE